MTTNMDEQVETPCAGGCGATITSTRRSVGLINKCQRCDLEFWSRLDVYGEDGQIIRANQHAGE